MIFNKHLTFDDHINAVVGKVYGALRPLRCAQSHTPEHIRMLLAKTCVMPILLYGCELFANCNAASKRKLNVAFNNVTRYVYGLSPYDHISSFAKRLYGINFDNLLSLRTLTFLHRILSTTEPLYLHERIQWLRSTRSRQLLVPEHHRSSSERHFFPYSIDLWNKLPISFKAIQSTAQFKAKLNSLFSNF